MDESKEDQKFSPSFFSSPFTILDNLLEGFQIISHDFRYLYVNNTLVIHGRRSREDLIGNKMTDIYPGIEKTEVFFNIQKCLENKTSIWMENEFVFPDQSKKWFEIRLQSIPEGVFILSIDISERKLAEENARAKEKAKEKAEKANRAKDSFLATMSHEIRTPLTGMLGMLEVLSLTNLNAEQRTTLNSAWSSGRSLLRIVSDILDWSKIEEGKLELAPHSTSIDLLLKEVVNTYSRVASVKNVVLWYHLDSRITSTYMLDSLRLSQILNNFVSNALKFTKDGEVEIRATLIKRLAGKDRIRFSVKDTGIGISKQNQEKLFQVYQQVDADTARMYGGTGLGLAICSKLSNLMGGELSLESEVDQGSTFSIALDLVISGKISENISHSHPEIERRNVLPLFKEILESPMVLAVDDHPTNRDLIGKQLKLLGLRVELAESGIDALDKWKTKKFDLIITDCHMPIMDGYELTKSIRKIELEEKLEPISIIAWTANILSEERLRCQEVGMNDLLTKPTDLELLRLMLSKWLRTDKEIPLKADVLLNKNQKQKSPIDVEKLNKVVAEHSMQLQLLKEFYSQIEMDHKKFIIYLISGETGKAEEIIHRIKGASLMVGATILSNICVKIENALNVQESEEVTQSMAMLNDAIVQIDVYIKKLEATPNN